MKYILLLLLFPLHLLGQVSSHHAPLNPDFANQIEKKGYVYPPHKASFNPIVTKGSQVLPSSYDLRDVNGVSYIPAIRNQNPYGTCWTFATYASLESNWKRSGDASFTDLSEGHLAKCHGYNFGIDDGGNEYMSTAYLTRLSGPVYESSDPYSEVNAGDCPSIDKNSGIPAYIDEVYWLGNNIHLTKKMIMEHGALSTSMHSDFSSTSYNSSDYTFFYNGGLGVNHGVSIVGWDDHKVVTGGNSGTPTNNGAWIVRNSWGEGANDEGYFYASYEDAHIGKSCELYKGKTAVTDIDTLFDYARLGAVTTYSVGTMPTTTGYGAVKYTTPQDVFMTHIGTTLFEEGTTVQFTICRQFDGTVFSDTIYQSQALFSSIAGYRKFECPTAIRTGDFYVITKFTTPYTVYALPAETVIENYAYPTIEENKMWVSADAKEWIAGGLDTDYDFDLAIKVYANYYTTIKPHFTRSTTTACTSQDVTFTNTSAGVADSFQWHFDDISYTTFSKDETISRNFNNTGQKSLTLKAFRNGTIYTFTMDNAVAIRNEISPRIIVLDAATYFSKRNSITLVGEGADSYEWYADGYLDGDTGAVITMTLADEDVWIRLNGTSGNCTAYDSVLIRVANVLYDNIEDALTLNVNETAHSITNHYASVQANEPRPESGSCSSQYTWCEEGGLQNSIWFKFTAPSVSIDSIVTLGFDNQIALYDATHSGTWQDILSGDPSHFNIIAANDDYHDVDYSAVINNILPLTSGKTYWIQMDGSAGGSFGTTDITIHSSGSTALHQDDKDEYSIINTPSLFKLQGKNLAGSHISIINSIGQLVYQTQIGSGTQTTSNQEFSNGFYLINIKGPHFNKVYKVVIADHWQLSIDAQ